MNTGIILITLVPLRSAPSESSEMISQLLFGEIVEILEQKGNWSFIKNIFDHYEGWIDTKTITPLQASAYQSLISTQQMVVDHLTSCTVKNYRMYLLPGSVIYNYDVQKQLFTIKNNQFEQCAYSPQFNTVEEVTKQFMHTPYLWGGKSLYGIDCSGLTQTVFKILGIAIPRDSSKQVAVGETINFSTEIKAGDLAFFDNQEGEIVHVGIILNKKEIIHASGHVRIDNIDQQGIFNIDKQKYSHKLRVLKRILQ